MIDLVSLLSGVSAIVGRVGTGKTYVAKGVVEQLLALGRRVVMSILRRNGLIDEANGLRLSDGLEG